jgi:hypothetical protein
MAVNKPTGDNARKGAVKKRTQRKGQLMGKTAWTKRSKESGRFMDVKKGSKKFNGVRKESWLCDNALARFGNSSAGSEVCAAASCPDGRD